MSIYPSCASYKSEESFLYHFFKILGLAELLTSRLKAFQGAAMIPSSYLGNLDDPFAYEVQLVSYEPPGQAVTGPMRAIVKPISEVPQVSKDVLLIRA